MRTVTMDDGNKVKIPKNPSASLYYIPHGALVKFGHKPIAVPKFVAKNKVLNKAKKALNV